MAEVISGFWKMTSTASILQRGTAYVLQLLSIIHDDPENIICVRKFFNMMRYQPLKSIQCRYSAYLLSKQTYGNICQRKKIPTIGVSSDWLTRLSLSFLIS
jgi:hypothetical protein